MLLRKLKGMPGFQEALEDADNLLFRRMWGKAKSCEYYQTNLLLLLYVSGANFRNNA